MLNKFFEVEFNILSFKEMERIILGEAIMRDGSRTVRFSPIAGSDCVSETYEMYFAVVIKILTEIYFWFA